ncbi:MAG: NUDIX domain-containing protein [Clostridia bacterium]
MPIIQDGAAIILVNSKQEILLQSRADRDKWGLPGGCQELKETFEQTIIREVKEETNLDIKKENLKLVGVISGESRYNTYENLPKNLMDKDLIKVYIDFIKNTKL